MIEYNFHETVNIYPSLNDQQFRLNKISEVRDYFIGEIKERKLTSKRKSLIHSKVINCFIGNNW